MPRADSIDLPCPTSGCAKVISAPQGLALNALKRHLSAGHALPAAEVDRLMHKLQRTFNPGPVLAPGAPVDLDTLLDLDTSNPAVTAMPDLSREAAEEQFWDRFWDTFWNDNFWPTFWDLLEDGLTTGDLDRPAQKALDALAKRILQTPIALKKSEEDAFWTTPVEWPDEKRKANP